MLSLKPRFDLYAFNFPKDMFPQELIDKYNEVLYKNSSVITNIVDYVNESIQSISIPGINAEPVEQNHRETNSNRVSSNHANYEPSHTYAYTSISNPLEMIDKEFKVTMRMNQGLYNYFFMYENFFYAVCKNINNHPIKEFKIQLLDETGKIISNILLKNLVITSLDGLDFTYNTVERESKTFEIGFRFNNIDFDFVV